MGVFACYDNRGQQVLGPTHRAELAVPEQVAVLGVDNDGCCAGSRAADVERDLNPRRVGRGRGRRCSRA